MARMYASAAMANKKRPQSDDLTLYDIDPAFQDKLATWLAKKPHGVIVDIGATPDAFKITFDPGGETLNASFEDALNEAMGSGARKKRIDPQLEERIHSFLMAHGAHLTFGASKDGVFNMTISNEDSRGAASDEDFEIAIVLAEEKFWENMPARPLPPEKRAALERALMSPEYREEEARERLRQALFVPRPELDMDVVPAKRPRKPKQVAALPSAPAAAAAAAAAPATPATDAERQELLKRTFLLSPAQRAEAEEEAALQAKYASNMDPDAALRRYWAAIEDGDVAEARSAKMDLMGWIERGGFEPDWAASGHSRTEFLALTGSSMRSRHGSPHGRYEENARGFRDPYTKDFDTFMGKVIRELSYHGVPGATDLAMENWDAIGFAHREGESANSVAERLMVQRWHSRESEEYAENSRWSRAYINSLPDSAFLYVEPGGERDEHGRSHPLSLRHLPYKNRQGKIDQAHLKNALARVHQEGTRLPKREKEAIFRKAEAIYEREFGHAHPMAANAMRRGRNVPQVGDTSYGDWVADVAERLGDAYELVPRDWLRSAYRAGYTPAQAAEEGTQIGSYDENPHPMAAGGGFHGVSRSQRAQRASAGAWRIHVAGGDIDPQRFSDYDEAAQHARSKYGPSGWQVEWASV